MSGCEVFVRKKVDVKIYELEAVVDTVLYRRSANGSKYRP